MRDDASKQKSRITLYVGVGYALLVIMAVTWALGSAFNYIFLGAAVFFFFLAFQQFRGTSNATFNWRDAPPSYRQANIFDQFMQAVTQLWNKRGSRVSTGSRKGVAGIAVVFVVFFIIVAVSIVIESAGDDDYTLGTWISKGNSFYGQQMYDSAMVNYNKALLVDPDSEEALTGIGNIKLVLGEYDSAVSYFDRVLANNSFSEDALYGKAYANYYLKNYDGALSALQEILDVDPNHVDALLLTGDCHYAMNDYESAIQHYETAYSLGARSFQLSNIMAYIYDTQKDYGKALNFYQEALQYDETNADIKRRVQELSSSATVSQ